MVDAERGARGRKLAAWAAGVAAAVLGVGLGELTAAFLAPPSSPLAVVGESLIDLAPAWAKDAAISLFGTNDKLALLVGIGIVLAVTAAFAGWLEMRAAPRGAIVMIVLGAVGVVAAVSREDAGSLSWLPATVAGGTAAVAVSLLTRPLQERPIPRRGAHPTDDDALSDDDPPRTHSRRTVLLWSGAAAAVGIAAAFAGRTMQVGTQAVEAVRRLVRLPTPAAAAAPVPAGAELGIPDLAPVVTPNELFYRIDTALVVPHIDPLDWSLRIHGLVDEEVTITWDELLALPLTESWTTLACVSNPVGGDLIGNARWLGYPIRELLARARPRPEADMVLSRSIDGFTASTPLEVLTDTRDAILAVGMNGEPLPSEHGFPVRMVVPGLYGYVSATKWVTELEVTRFDQAAAYWTTRGWSERGPIKLQSRIDVPRPGAAVAAGDTVIAGVAWQQHVGVRGVEVQIDEGEWQSAELATAISDDTWVQWRMPWTAAPGQHSIRCRAIGADGTSQTAAEAPPAPDGATGWHTIEVSVG